jgi:hypothetical protein
MEAQERNFAQWPILGVYVWPNPWPYATTYMGEVSNLKTWMHNRLSWLDSNMPGTCDPAYGIAEDEAKKTLNIYPNPVIDNLNIKIRVSVESLVGIMIFNQQGMVLTTFNPVARSSGEWTESLDISSFKPGVYLVRITINGNISTKRFIKI